MESFLAVFFLVLVIVALLYSGVYKYLEYTERLFSFSDTTQFILGFLAFIRGIIFLTGYFGLVITLSGGISVT